MQYYVHEFNIIFPFNYVWTLMFNNNINSKNFNKVNQYNYTKYTNKLQKKTSVSTFQSWTQS